ncbi:MarR family winged helix-turn-helix transcriptional regulator [Puerhibacterium puerhi]|uniref:MarR family winged helix-turn-helix transcriptional regulator n=1 Tax=Puerhibacterium puerhi TaxID=2692623 RepID=UPI001358B5B5|nr:MarR family transcriptional regulator [Puerhibacterium puerhi]
MSTELRELLGDLVQANGRLVRVAARHLAGTRAAAESPAVWRTLGVLASRGPMRVSELAAHSRVAAPTMTKLVATLLERGHVRRTSDPSDARASTISITDDGRAAYDEWRGAVAAALAPYFTDLAPADLDALRRTVRLLQDRIELGESETRTEHQDADLEVSTK